MIGGQDAGNDRDSGVCSQWKPRTEQPGFSPSWGRDQAMTHTTHRDRRASRTKRSRVMAPETKTGKGCSTNHSGSPLPSQKILRPTQHLWTLHCGRTKKGEPWPQWNIITSFLTRDTGYHLKKNLNYWVWMNLNRIGHLLSLRLYFPSQPS